jgi:hypothetical protein
MMGAGCRVGYMCAVGWGCDGSRSRDTHTVPSCVTLLCGYVGVIEVQDVCCVGKGMMGGSGRRQL